MTFKIVATSLFIAPFVLSSVGCNKPGSTENQADSGVLSLNLPKRDDDTKEYLQQYSLGIAASNCNLQVTGTNVAPKNTEWSNSTLEHKVKNGCDYQVDLNLGKSSGTTMVSYFSGQQKITKDELAKANGKSLNITILAKLTAEGEKIEILKKRYGKEGSGLPTEKNGETDLSIEVAIEGIKNSTNESNAQLELPKTNPAFSGSIVTTNGGPLPTPIYLSMEGDQIAVKITAETIFIRGSKKLETNNDSIFEAAKSRNGIDVYGTNNNGLIEAQFINIKN